MPIPLLLHGKHAAPGERQTGEGALPPVRYELFGPWIVPWVLRSVEDEYRALRTRVGLIDCSTFALIECAGIDRADFLHRVLTNDIKRIAPGSGCRAALLTPSAQWLADCLVLADRDSHWLLCDLTRAPIVAQILERYRFTEQVTCTNHERRFGALALQGPRTIELVEQVWGRVAALSQPGDHAVAPLLGQPTRLVRYSLAGEVGMLCLVDAEAMCEVWNLLVERGRPSGLQPLGWQALNIARIEAGRPWGGVDFDETNYWPETGLEAETVSGAKGCYVGQEIIARMAAYGSPRRKLMGLLIEGAAVPASPDPILLGEEPVGAVTSACYSLALQRPIAMGYLTRGCAEPRLRVAVVTGGRRLAATVTRLPFPDPRDVGPSPGEA